jgi:hypothetical protein
MSQFREPRRVRVTLKNNVGSSSKTAVREFVVDASSPMQAVEFAERAILDQVAIEVLPLRLKLGRRVS